jgi:ATP-dependent RNA helicase RhlE
MSKSFADLGVSKPVADALRSRGITEPFPVQQLVIEDVLEGHDVLVQSPTGSGKTLAFGVPMLERIDSNGPRPAALILAPTRELACQIVDELESLCYARALKIATVYGGVGINPQIKAVRKAHVVVATPGRLEDLIQRRAIDLSKIRTLVLDEADRMLDMGFRPPVDRIVSLLPRKRQTLFFSATLDGQAGEVAREYTYKPRTHTHAPEPEGPAAITHSFSLIESQAAKIEALISELRGEDCGRTLVFVRTKRGADRLVKKLGQRNVKALAMHGDKSQGQRQKALARFERGDLMTLVATDVAARGIDVADITDVINFDIPEDRETYTHRTGRTGRAGAEGRALTFVLADQRSEVRTVARDLGLVAEYERGVGTGGGRPDGQRNGNGNGKKRGPKGGRPNGGHNGRKHQNRSGGGSQNGNRNHNGNRKRGKRPARAGGGGGR